MANTYTQIYIQFVFAVQERASLVAPKHQEELNKYITGITRNKGSVMIAVNGMPDHLHILLGLNPGHSISDLARDLKSSSTDWINRKRWFNGNFYWQEGFGAFSYSRSQIDRVAKYIMNQQAHHSKRTFRDEYISLLRKFDIGFENKYLFKQAQ